MTIKSWDELVKSRLRVYSNELVLGVDYVCLSLNYDSDRIQIDNGAQFPLGAYEARLTDHDKNTYLAVCVDELTAKVVRHGTGWSATFSLDFNPDRQPITRFASALSLLAGGVGNQICVLLSDLPKISLDMQHSNLRTLRRAA